MTSSLSLALDADAARQKIVSRQSDTRLQQQVSLAQTRLEAARRELARAETLHKESLYSSGDFERAKDALHVADRGRRSRRTAPLRCYGVKRTPTK